MTLYDKAEKLLQIISSIKSAVRRQNYGEAGRLMLEKFVRAYREFLEGLIAEKQQFLDKGYEIDVAAFLNASVDIMKAQEQKDYVLLADYQELLLKPLLESVLELLRESAGRLEGQDYREENRLFFKEFHEYHGVCTANKEKRRRDCHIELTQQGPPTIRIERGKESFYLHSNVNPWEEADYFAMEYADMEAEEYVVLGLGLGYHAIRLWQYGGGAVPVHVYEQDEVVAGLAERYQSFQVCREETFSIHYDPQLTQLQEKLKAGGTRLVIHYPSIRSIRDAMLKAAFERFFVADSSERNQKRLLFGNFRSNIRGEVHFIEETGAAWKGKDVYIIAAGPSLDKNIELLRERPSNSVIVATGTVFAKLSYMEIRPDYGIITDANERIISQILRARESQREGVPLLLLSTAYYRLKGITASPKYFLLQKDFAPAEAYAAEHGRMLVETGGSVSTAALDASIRMGAGRIIFLGLDLAFTDNLAHAAGTSNRIALDREELYPVKSYDGGTVYADTKFNMYAEWIEERIRRPDAAGIPIINATEGGRYLDGMEYRTLNEVLKGYHCE